MSQHIKRAFLDTEDDQILYRIGGEGEPLLLSLFQKKTHGYADGMNSGHQ